MNDLEGCAVTFEQSREELEGVEEQLARKHGIRKYVRRTLMAMMRSGEIVEDELVAQWHDAYSAYLDWTRNENWEAPPPAAPPPKPPHTKAQRIEEAAETASSLFVARNGPVFT